MVSTQKHRVVHDDLGQARSLPTGRGDLDIRRLLESPEREESRGCRMGRNGASVGGEARRQHCLLPGRRSPGESVHARSDTLKRPVAYPALELHPGLVLEQLSGRHETMLTPRESSEHPWVNGPDEDPA
jgi:hypothetical protein